MFIAIAIWLHAAPAVHAEPVKSPVLAVRIEALFSGDRNFVDVKPAIDKIVRPSLNTAASADKIDRMAADLARMSADVEDSPEKLEILRRYLYEPGQWNDNRPFAYDAGDPPDKRVRNRLLVDYIADAIATSDRLLRYEPRSVYLILARGTPHGGLRRRDLIANYRIACEMPPEVREYADHLYRDN